MKKYEVHCKYRNVGDQGILYLGRYVIVEALDEREARMKAIEVVHNSGRFEHVTPYTCILIEGEQP